MIENRRFILFCALGIVIFLMYQEWQKDYGQKADVPYASSVSEAVDSTSSPQISNPGATPGDLPAIGAEARPSDGEPVAAAATPLKGEIIRVETDLLRVQINTAGGTIERVELKGVPISKDKPDVNLNLLDNRLPNFFVTQSGLVASGGRAPTHHDIYRAQQKNVALADGANTVEVRMDWQGGEGLQVTKVFIFHRDSYEIDLRHEVQAGPNAGDLKISPYVRLWRTPFTEASGPPFVPVFMGLALYEQKETGSEEYRYEKIAFDDLVDEPINGKKQDGGWIGMMQHYFLAAILPPAEEIATYSAKPLAVKGNTGYSVDYVGARHAIAAGESRTFASRLYIGPKYQDRLADVAPGLELTVDYGMLTFLSEPLFWVLKWIHDLVGNWGWAIVILTLIIKGIFYKLSEHQYRAMARMRKFAPRIQSLKERYADDREGMQKAMMDLYKKEGFNPLGGCWPMLVQIPVFIALYWVLLESVELRQAPWILWIQDMSAPDPFYILPVLFGVSMFVQQKLSGSAMTMDEMQQKVMMIMPVMLAVFFAFFPAGLVLYWLVSNLVGIAQQWYIYRKLESEGLK